jgi:nitrate/TMAO reductase-like tetraheme cytochrome c subunit
VGVALVAVLVALVAVAVYFTAQPSFFAQYPQLQRSYTALQTSSHKGMRCDQCHVSRQNAAVYEAALVGEFYRGLVRRPRTPVFVRLPAPSREACLACHRYGWSDETSRTAKVPHPAHLRVATETRECVICHKWTAHEEKYQAKHTTMRFSTVCASFECHVGVKPANDCKNCHHVLQESLGAWKEIHPKTVRANGPNGCLETCHTADQCRLCHTTGKTPVFAATITQSGVKAIEQQHVLPDWMAKHGAMALADQSKCLICHVSEGECQDCHSKRPAFHGPQDSWLGAHQPIAKKNPQRCLTCHKQTWCDECHKQFKEMR